MKTPLLPFIGLMLAASLSCYSQTKTYSYGSGNSRSDCEILTDTYGRIATRCILSRPDNSIRETITLGTTYFNDTVWQQGKVDLDGHGKEQACWISYNLSPAEILCYFDEPNKQVPVTPYTFTLGNTRFVSYEGKIGEKAYRTYFELVYVGKLKLLKHCSIAIDAPPFELKNYYNSWFRPIETYYLQRENEPPVEIQLTDKSLQKALAIYSDSPSKSASASRKKLTVDEVIAALRTE